MNKRTYIAAILTGLTLLFIGEVWPIRFWWSAPAAIAVLRLFVITAGPAIRDMGEAGTARVWMWAAALGSAAYIWSLHWTGHIDLPAMIALQFGNILLIGTEQFAGLMLRPEFKPVEIKAELDGLRDSIADLSKQFGIQSESDREAIEAIRKRIVDESEASRTAIEKLRTEVGEKSDQIEVQNKKIELQSKLIETRQNEIGTLQEIADTVSKPFQVGNMRAIYHCGEVQVWGIAKKEYKCKHCGEVIYSREPVND